MRSVKKFLLVFGAIYLGCANENSSAAEPIDAGEKLQVRMSGGENRWGNCRIRIGIRTEDVAEEIYASLAQKDDYHDFFEFRTRVHPEYGPGGHIQIDLRNVTARSIATLEEWNPITKTWDRLF